VAKCYDYSTGGSSIKLLLPKVQTPRGSIIALDVESGYQSTQAIDHACQRIKDAGYTPMVYGYKNFLVNNTDLHYLASKYQLWLAEYPNYSVTREPNYNFFPSFENIGMFQYTSTAIAGGLDRNIDLTGITDNGYTNGNAQKPKTETPATEQGKQLHQDTHNYVVKSGDSWWKIANDHGMDMYALAKLNGSTINSVIYPGQVLRVADKGEGNSVSNKVQKPVPSTNTQRTSTYTVRYGDSWWKIANDHGMSMYTLAQINGKSIYNTIYPGQVLKISGNAQVQQRKSYTVRYGDNLSTIAYRLGTSVNHLVATNGLRNANLIYPGQVLSY
jgi:lysozyme